MRYKVQTLSGAQYLIDTDAMTWQRMRPKSGVGIIGTDKDDGTLEYPLPYVVVGEPAVISIRLGGEATYIRTTEVQRIELLS